MSFGVGGFRDDPSTLNEMETKISSLERSNFDLKLRLHYLNKKYMEASGSNDVQGGLGGGLPHALNVTAANQLATTSHGAAALGNLSSSMIHPGISQHVLEGSDDKSVDLLQLREENDFLKRRVIELESHNLQLQLLRDHDQQEYQKIISLKPSTIVQQEEHRKREREVAMAIAEHDAALIKKLQEELTFLNKQKEVDQKMIENITEQVAKKTSLLEDKEKEINRLQEINKDLHHQLEMVFDRQKLMDLHATNQLHFNQAIVSASGNSNDTNSIGPHGLGGVQRGDNSTSLVPYNLSDKNSANGHSSPMVFSASSNGKQTSILINSNSFTTAANIGGFPAQFKGVEQFSSPHMSNGNGATSFTLQSHDQVTSFNLGMGSNNTGGYNNAPFRPVGNENTSVDNQSDTQLRDENSMLRQRLFKLQGSIDSQNSIINMLKASVSELSSMEAEEIKRLEIELDRLLDDKERLRQSYTKLEVELEFRTQELVKYRRVFGDVDSIIQGKSVEVSNGLNKEAFERTIELYK